MNMHGFDSVGYAKGELGAVNFWASNRVDDKFEAGKFCVELSNPLVVESCDYNLSDLYFATMCVGYAVEHGYDSVIIEANTTKFAITIDLDDSANYLLEADDKPLSDVQISPENRKTLQGRSTKNKPKQGTIPTTQEKAPPKGIRVDVLLANTGKLSPDRVERAMKGMRKSPPKLTGVVDIQGQKYFRAEYNFRSAGAPAPQIGYADISQNKTHCTQLFCSCSDFFYRLYAPYVKAGLSTWNLPPKYRVKQNTNNKIGVPSNHKWTVDTNPEGKLFLCKHLWAFLAYYVAGEVGGSELSDEEIEAIISKHFVDIDGDGEEERVSTDFEKAFGKLTIANKGKDIEHIAKPLQGKKLPPKPIKKIEPNTDKQDILSQIDKAIEDNPTIDKEGMDNGKENK